MPVRRDDQLRSNRLRALSRRRYLAGNAFQRPPRLDPVSKASAIVAYIRVTKLLQQSDRLLAQWSGEFRAIDGDFGVRIRKKLPRPAGDGIEWQVDSARNMFRRVRFGGQDIHNRERRGVQAASEFVARYFRHVRRAC